LSTDFIYREEGQLQEDINAGVPFSTYIPVIVTDPGPDGIPGNADDGGPITVFNQDPSTFGQDKFVLTNLNRGHKKALVRFSHQTVRPIRADDEDGGETGQRDEQEAPEKALRRSHTTNCLI
jgi:hypothetical protein